MPVTQFEILLAALLPFVFCLALGGPYIRLLQKRYMGQYIREDGPKSHHAKAGTPTAGGVLILGALTFALLAMIAIKGASVFLTIPVSLVAGITLAFGLLGFVDDYLKITKKKNKGVSGYTKLLVQVIAGLAVGAYVLKTHPGAPVGFFGLFSLGLGWFYPPFSALVLAGTSNAVNLTDGLDGLASGTALLSFVTLGMLLLAAGQNDLALVALMLAGATLGFLVFNHYPARIFMGDTGSLALGGALGAIALLARMEFWLLLLGLVFVLEALSVILQVASFKTTGRRLFRMSPLHHHFELGGWSEIKVVSAFITLQMGACLLAVLWYFSVK